MGANSTWAVDYLTTSTGIVGAADNTSGFNVKASKSMPLAAGDEYVITFVNYNKGAEGTNYWANWSFMSNVFSCRADHGESNPYWGSATNVNYTGNSWSNIYSTIQQWLQAYNGVTVTLTVSRNAAGDGITISHTATTNAVDPIASQTYAGTFTATVDVSEVINFYLTVENAHLKITNVYANAGGVEKNYALLDVDHTASSSRNGTNEITTTVDAENEHYNNLKAAAWGGWAYAQFSYTIPVGYSIESATLTWSTTIGGNSGTRNNDIYYVNAGTSIDYAGLTSTTNLNPDATFIVGVSKTGPATHTGIETDVTSALRTIAASQNYIIFKWTNNAAGANLHGKSSANPPTLELVTSAETFYDATFNANDGALNPSVTVYTDAGRTSSIAKDALSANTTYYFTATLAGYEDYEGSFAVETSNPTVNFTMTALPRYTFTVNLINSVGGAVIETLYTDDDSYDGKKHDVGFSKYLTDGSNRVTFAKDDDTYYTQYVSASATKTQTVSYTAYDGVAYFFEGESFAALGTKETNGNYSGNKAGRGLNNATLDIFTIPATGKYTLSYAVCSNNVGTGKETQYSFYKNNSGNVIEDVTDLNHSVNNIKTTGTRSVDNIAFAAGDVLQFYSKETKIILDYVLLTLNSVPAAIGTTGYTTFASSYPLNIDGMTASTGTVKAYYVTASDVKSSSVALTEVTGNVEAGTGLILEGTDGAAITIPVVASGTDLSSTNMLVGCTTATDITASTPNYENFYVLSATEAAFKKIKTWVDTPNTLTIPAGKAYLDTTGANVVGAPTLTFDLGGVTAITNTNCTNNTNIREVYNLNGQRVAQPTKGLYIVNGKKVVIK